MALQLGGSTPSQLAVCAMLGQRYHYDEINLNVGCPSHRVKSGRFGACLIKEPALVADCIKAMQDIVTIPVTVKTRTGVDHHDSYQQLCDFVGQIAQTGCQVFIIHARKAWLQDLSPKQNREIPPLQYQRVYQLKRDFPDLQIIINGGIGDYLAISDHLKQVDGVMIGREAYHTPYLLSQFDRLFYHDEAVVPTRLSVLEAYQAYVRKQLALAVPLRQLVLPLFDLFRSMLGGKRWRQYLTESLQQSAADERIIERAISAIDATVSYI